MADLIADLREMATRWAEHAETMRVAAEDAEAHYPGAGVAARSGLGHSRAFAAELLSRLDAESVYTSAEVLDTCRRWTEQVSGIMDRLRAAMPNCPGDADHADIVEEAARRLKAASRRAEEIRKGAGREENLRGVTNATFRALVAAGPEIGDAACIDLAHAVKMLADERDASRAAGRREGLEEAARVCDACAATPPALPVEHAAASGALAGAASTARSLAARIRTLSGQPPDPVREAAPELLAALRELTGWTMRLPGEDANDTFERLADDFYRDTGMLRPGKSQPLEVYMGNDEDGRRARAWAEWCAQKRGHIEARCFAAIAKATAKETTSDHP